MTKPISIKPIEKATNISWKQWLVILEDMNAKDLSHKEIAQKVHNMLKEKFAEQNQSSGHNFNVGWWAQGVTVAYEQHIGRRIPGQQADGTFAVSANKTFNGSINEALDYWHSAVDSLNEFNGIKITGEPSTSETEKWRNWRVSLADGTKVVVSINQKQPGKANISVNHQKLVDVNAIESWRAFWREFMAKI